MPNSIPQYMTTCLGIRNATLRADARSIERISCFIICPMLLTHWADNNNVDNWCVCSGGDMSEREGRHRLPGGQFAVDLRQ